MKTSSWWTALGLSGFRLPSDAQRVGGECLPYENGVVRIRYMAVGGFQLP